MPTSDDGGASNAKTTTQPPRKYPFGEAEGLSLRPELAELQSSRALARVRLPYGGDAWLATSYEDVRAVLGDPRFSRAAAFGKDVPRLSEAINTHATILDMDPPDHTRLRRLVAMAFTPKRVEALRPRTQEIVDGLLERMAVSKPPVDLMESLAWPLPITVICALMGVPVEDTERFRSWTDTALAVTAFSGAEIRQGMENLRSYIAGLIAERRDTPRDDLLGAMVQARDAEDRLSENELVMFGVTLLVAGHETTANTLGNFIYTLLTHPEQLARLRTDPSLVPSAIEELLRYTPLSGSAGFVRIATEDVELSGGRVRAGDAVLTETAAANRDEQAFEHAETIDIGRTNNPHLSFGHGVHYCIGAQLARMELTIALGTLLRRFPDLALAVDADKVEWKRGRRVRGLHSLPVTWSEVRP